jgi:hypothetical protein
VLFHRALQSLAGRGHAGVLLQRFCNRLREKEIHLYICDGEERRRVNKQATKDSQGRARARNDTSFHIAAA